MSIDSNIGHEPTTVYRSFHPFETIGLIPCSFLLADIQHSVQIVLGYRFSMSLQHKSEYPPLLSFIVKALLGLQDAKPEALSAKWTSNVPTTDSEKYTMIRNLLALNCCLNVGAPHPGKLRKSNVVAESLLSLGQTSFASKDLSSALDFANGALAQAETFGQSVACFKFRAKVFRAKGLIHLAHADEAALKIGDDPTAGVKKGSESPMKTKTKKRPDVEASSHTGKLHGARIALTDARVPYFEATRNLDPGDFVVMEQPYTHCLLAAKREKRCHRCMEPCETYYVPCQSCSYVSPLFISLQSMLTFVKSDPLLCRHGIARTNARRTTDLLMNYR